MPFILEDAENGLSAVSREMFQEMYERLKVIDDQIKAQDRRIARLCQENELSNRFIEVPGIGPIISTIICADLGENAKGYESGRDYAASLGIVPKQHSSGGKDRYFGISKRGNGYIRCMLIHGARSALKQCANKKDKLSVWFQQLIISRGFNKAAVALANKNARILWAMAKKNATYVPAAMTSVA